MIRVALLVSHLMGSGHLVRTLAIARALAAEGAAPTVLSGGRPLAHVDASGVEFVQLPPLASNGLDYKTLLDAEGRPADAAYLEARRTAILDALGRLRPQALVTELYPFGRRNLADEFGAAVTAVRPYAAVLASVRDVLEPPSKPARVEAAMERFAPFDAALVHGDPDLLPLERSYPLPEATRAKLIYTGYVAPSPPPRTPGEGEGEVVVSVGGGVIGRRLLEIAALAARRSPLRWRLLVGGADAGAEAARLAALGPATVEPARPDYLALLRRAAVSVSLCGYNTAAEVALSGTPAILVPMEEGGEREQLIRAEAFATLPEVEVRRIGDLDPGTLAAAAAEAATRPRRPAPLRADGAREAARAILAAAG